MILVIHTYFKVFLPLESKHLIFYFCLLFFFFNVLLTTQLPKGTGGWRGKSWSYGHSHQETILNLGFGKLNISDAHLHIPWLCFICFTIFSRLDSCLIRIHLDPCWFFSRCNLSSPPYFHKILLSDSKQSH